MIIIRLNLIRYLYLMKPAIFLLLVCSLLTKYSTAQNGKTDSLLTGAWKGSSICQIRPSACNDEIAVYHITASAKPGWYHVVMNKVVNGAEEDMAEYDYRYDPAAETLTALDTVRKLTWKFTVKDQTMEGTLSSQGKIYRVIKLKKA